MRISERENTHEGEIAATDMEEYKQILIHSCISHDSVEGSPKCLKGQRIWVSTGTEEAHCHGSGHSKHEFQQQPAFPIQNIICILSLKYCTPESYEQVACIFSSFLLVF